MQLCIALLDAALAAVMDDSDETGWKYIHGDVFRFPPHKNLFCAFVGSGAQVTHLPCWSVSLSCPPAVDCMTAVQLALCIAHAVPFIVKPTLTLTCLGSWCFTFVDVCSLTLQLFTLALFIFTLACLGSFYPYNRGGLFTALIVLYALTASISGYMAASYYRQM